MEIAIAISVIVFILAFWTVLNQSCLSEGIAAGLCLGIVSFFLTISISGVISLIVLPLGANYGPIDKQYDTELIALNDNYSIEGDKFLFSGHIDEELKYVYLYKQEGKGITSAQIDADKTYMNYIKEGEKPHIIKQYVDFQNPIIRFFTVGESYEYYLYIPEGSITVENKYNIDLE